MSILEVIALLGWVLMLALFINAPFYIRNLCRKKQLYAEQSKAIRDDLESRTCPVCKQQYGEKVDPTHYSEPYETIEVGDQKITRAVILTCPSCEYTTVFDPEGKPIKNFTYKRTEVGLVGWDSSC